MNYFSVETALTIVEMLNSEPRYMPNLSSAKCPLCGNWAERANKASRTKDDCVYRYFKCPDCGLQFAAVEKLTPEVEIRMGRKPSNV